MTTEPASSGPGTRLAFPVDMSRIALTAWEGRISPLFDVARRFLIVDLDGRVERAREIVLLGGTEPGMRAQGLAARHVDVLICGAISQPVERTLEADGVTVVSGICGDVEVALASFLVGHLDDDEDLHLPGWYPVPPPVVPGGARGGPRRVW